MIISRKTFSLTTIITFLTVLITVIITLRQSLLPQQKTIIITNALVTIIPQNLEVAKVKSTIDGDTIELENGQKVRYIGVDTPETKHPNKPRECYGQEAWEKNRQLVEGKNIYLQKDKENKDKYDRLLRYVFLPNPKQATQEALFVNRYLVEEGYGRAIFYRPNITYSLLFTKLQNQAKNQKKGLWGSCDY